MENKNYHSKLLISISDLSQLSLKADGYVLGYEKYTSFAAHLFTYEEIKSIKNRKKIFILLNAMIHEKDLSKFEKEANRLIKLNVNFIVQDAGALYYLENKIDSSRIIYYPYTLICQKDEVKGYRNLTNACLGISNEITLKETEEITKEEGTMVNVFGYQVMYQSYRKILSLFMENKNLFFKNENISIKEDTRDELYKVEENEYGSVIYRPFILSYLEDIHYVNNATYLFMDSHFIDIDTFNLIVEYVNKLLNKEIDEEEMKRLLESTKLPISNPFKDKKTILNKE